MIAMRMMQVSLDDVIHVIPMRHGFMAALGAVLMGRIMFAALMLRCALIGIRGIHVQSMFLDLISIWMVHMAIM